jgi:ABC-type phosphate transport system ATPase subunit
MKTQWNEIGRTSPRMVFQKPNPFPKSIYDNVAFGLRINGERDRGALDEIVERSLREAALWDEVIVTHNMQQAARVSDRTAFFSVLANPDSEGDTRAGTLIEYGRTAQIFEDPRDSRTQAYVTGRIG